MRSLVRRNINGVVLMALVFGQILMVGHQVRTRSGASRLQYWSSSLLLPVQSGAGVVFGFLGRSFDRYVWLVGAEEENRRLDAQAARLRMENHFLRQKLLRFESRTELNAYSAHLASATLPASVIAEGPSRSAKEVFLNRGQDHGVRPGMAVVTADGIVGKVEAAHGATSMVLLISDSEAGAGVVLGRSGEPGVLRGTSRRNCRVDYIGPDVDVVSGEFVYTSGLDGVFPRGLPVGQVTAVRPRVETQFVEVRPFAELDRLDEVLVILEADHEALPEAVQQSLVEASGMSAGRGDGLPGESLPTQADRVKQTYRNAVAAQGKRVGIPSYGTGVPDFGAAVDPLRASGSIGTADREQPQ